MREKFYICRHCGNLIGLIHDAGVPMMCCGQKMEALVPNTTEAAREKHLPYVHKELRMAVSGEPLGLAIHRKLLFAPAKISLLQFMLTATSTDFGKLKSSKSKMGL